LTPGDRLGGYDIIGGLGAGGMGEVYRARDTRLDRAVALKVLPPDLATDSKRLGRFQREARALAALDHPHIVTIYSVESAPLITSRSDGPTPELHFLTMQLVEGHQLDELIPPRGMDLEPLMAIAIALASALAAAHAKGIVHRDLKPSNVMVTANRQPKVLDFGLAKLHSVPDAAETSLETWVRTEPWTVLGTLPYMSPEQLQGAEIDHRSDLFSFGVLLYEMATGKRPFSGASPAAQLSSTLRDVPAPLTSLRPDLPADLERIVGRCLDKTLEARYQSAAELRRHLGDLSVTDSSPPVPQRSDKPASPSLNKIAVLPLTHLSADADQEYFADGMTEALITDLAKVASLKVISRTSVMQYRNTTKTSREIGAELGVGTLIEGTILTVGDRVRIATQLVRADTDEHLWAERFDSSIEDILDLQVEVARAVAGQVDETLTHSDEGRLETRGKVDPEVFRLVLQGRHHWNNRTETGFRAGLSCFQKALDRDASYAPAYVGVADCLNMLVNYGILPPRQVHTRSLAALENALELDPESADAHRTLAQIRWQIEFDWRGAIEEYERAVEIAPNSPLTTYWYGVYLGVIGWFGQGHKWLERAAELDPLSLVVPAVQGWLHYFEREFDEAVTRERRLLDLDPDYLLAQWFLGQALVEIGDFEGGIAALDTALRLSGRSSRMLGYLGYGYGRAGRGDEARALLEELETRSTSTYVPPYFPALVHCGLGEATQALDLLEQAYSERDTMIRDLKADPPWDQIKDQPRYQELMAEMAFPPPPDQSR
jgi:serine/threonine protein kinase